MSQHILVNKWTHEQIKGYLLTLGVVERYAEQLAQDTLKALPYNPRHVPSLLGYVSLGQDYAGVVYIDCADVNDPVMLYGYDALLRKQFEPR